MVHIDEQHGGSNRADMHMVFNKLLLYLFFWYLQVVVGTRFITTCNHPGINLIQGLTFLIRHFPCGILSSKHAPMPSVPVSLISISVNERTSLIK